MDKNHTRPKNVGYGAERTRTSGLAFRKRLLYPLSYSPSNQMIPQASTQGFVIRRR